MLQADCTHDLACLPHHEKVDRCLATTPIVVRQFRLLQQLKHTRSIAPTLRLYQERLDMHAAIVAVEKGLLTLKHEMRWGAMRMAARRAALPKWWFHSQAARQSRRRISAQPEGKGHLRAHCVVVAR
jgi:hypothetical protein